jgi:hypothetical protein
VCGGRSYGESNEDNRSGNIRHLAIFISMALMACIAAMLQLGNKMDARFCSGGSFADYDVFVVIVIIIIIIIIIIVIKLYCSIAGYRGV